MKVLEHALCQNYILFPSARSTLTFPGVPNALYPSRSYDLTPVFAHNLSRRWIAKYAKTATARQMILNKNGYKEQLHSFNTKLINESTYKNPTKPSCAIA
jgi:hypothetical protein